ncbi:MAG: HipA domain-containing protein [Blautia sp.]|nr:HipA domain-containing protein [Blautia sp.]
MIIDFTDCPDGYRDYGGSDSKRSIEYEDNKYMLKLPEHQEKKNDLQTSHVNNVLSEYLGSRIMASLGLDVHETILGLYHGQPAVACKDFAVGGYRLQEFSWMMRSLYDKSQVGRIPTYRQIYDVMDRHPLLQGIKEQSINRYWETFVGDALIGNFDRHKGNWGYLVNEQTRDVRLAPVYDCGSCLYPGLSEDAMKKVLGSHEEILRRMYEFPKAALDAGGPGKRENKIRYFEMLASGKDMNCTFAFQRIYQNIDMGKIEGIIQDAPFMSDMRIEFYTSMLRCRKELILDRAYEQILEQSLDRVNMRANGDLTVMEFSGPVPAAIVDSIRPGQQALMVSEFGESYFAGEPEICERLSAGFGGTMAAQGRLGIWHISQCGAETMERIESLSAYMVKELDLER